MKKWFTFAFLSMLLNGIVLVFQKYVTILNFGSFIDHYLGLCYLIGSIASAIIVVKKKYPIKLLTVLYGLAGGILSYTGSYLYVKLMGVFTSSLIVPVFSIGGIVFTAIGSVIIFNEKITKKMKAAMAVGILAVAFLCI